MSNRGLYTELADIISLRGGHVPVVKNDEFYSLVEELFTEVEAELAVKMPLDYFRLTDFVENSRTSDVKLIEDHLETMVDKGLMIVQKRDTGKYYKLPPLVPGIMELQAFKDEVNDRSKKIARLLINYYNSLKKVADSHMSREGPRSASARLISVERRFPEGLKVLSYEEALEYANASEQVTAGICLDRHLGALLERPCAKPKEVCMGLSRDAKAIADRGFVKLISKDEARSLLDLSEEAGLIHLTIIEPGKTEVEFICNCCICHCRVLKGLKFSPVPSQAVISKFILKIDYAACNGCGMCIDRCVMTALKLDNGNLVHDLDRCVGCGLCRYVCPVDAMKLELKGMTSAGLSSQ